MRSIWISVGELSGDQRASELLQAYPDNTSTRFLGITGPRLRAQGVDTIVDAEKLQTIGIAEALAAIPSSLAILNKAERSCRRQKPDLAVLVDYGEFHMRLGRKLRRLGIPVFHLAPPKLWAWGSWRVRRLQQSADMVGVLFPFEQAFYERRGIPAVCVGHPAATPIDPLTSRDKLLLLPGSRRSEMSLHTQLLLDATERPARDLNLKRVIALAPGQSVPDTVQLPADIELRPCNSPADYRDAALALAASGTVNIELAAQGIPHVVCYITSAITAGIARHLIQTQWLNPVNITANRPILEEFVQERATVKNLERALESTWEKRKHMTKELLELASTLHQPDGMSAVWDACEGLIHG